MLALVVPPSWLARVGVVSARLLQGICWAGVPAIAYLVLTRDKGLIGWIFGVFAIGALVAVSKMMSAALRLDGVTAVRVDPEEVVVTSGRGRNAKTTRVPRAEITALRIQRGVARYRGEIRSRWMRLYAERSDGDTVYLGWLRLREEHDAAAEAAAAEIVRRMGTSIVEGAREA